MTDSRYRTYKDCTIDELEDIVNDLENMSISALKNKKLDIRKTILSSVIEAKKEIEKRLKK
jgi:hypothetical protein